MAKTAKQKSESRELEPAEVLAFAKCYSEKQIKSARAEVDAGSVYEIDFTCRIAGDLVINHDQSVASSTKPSAATLAAAFLATIPIAKRQATVDKIIQAGVPEPDEQLDQLAESVIAGLTTHGTGNRRGAVTGKLTCDVLA